MSEFPDVAVIISSYNRGNMLRSLLESLVRQEACGVEFELLVVDNNSTDNTREIVESFVERYPRLVKYLFEERQGVSYGRNTGIRASRAPLLAFVDDDVQVTSNWVATIKRAFDDYPEAAYLGGKVLPAWKVAMPLWLTRNHWAPLAIQDYGDRPFLIPSANRVCLIGASLAFRRSPLEAIGMFSPDLQRVKDGIGSMEDLEIQLRAWQTGQRGLYFPDMLVTAEIPDDRLTKEYHRRWHNGHGHYYAILRLEEMERSRMPRFLDVPAHLYRQTAAAALYWLKNVLTRNYDKAFDSEIQLHFFKGFFQKRCVDSRKQRKDTLAGESFFPPSPLVSSASRRLNKK